MDQERKLAFIAMSICSGLMSAQARASDMDVHVVKGKDGKEYFCANAKCAGNSSCQGAGNASCGGQNKCASSSQGFLTGWFYADTQAECEKSTGKWMLFKKEYSFKQGNKPPLAKKK